MEELPGETERRAALDAGSSKTARCCRHEIGAASNVAARGCERAARVFDERASDQMGSNVAWLALPPQAAEARALSE